MYSYQKSWETVRGGGVVRSVFACEPVLCPSFLGPERYTQTFSSSYIWRVNLVATSSNCTRHLCLKLFNTLRFTKRLNSCLNLVILCTYFTGFTGLRVKKSLGYGGTLKHFLTSNCKIFWRLNDNVLGLTQGIALFSKRKVCLFQFL